MAQKTMNVWDRTQERLRIIFEEFDNIYVSFSGGKDSGVLLNLCIDYIRQHGLNRKIGVYHMDYEGQYQHTTDYVTETMTSNLDVIDPYWVCVPVKAQCAASMYQSYWQPWHPDEKDIWVRDMPDSAMMENDFNFDTRVWDYEFNKKFHRWYHQKNKAEKTICLVGIREQESLHRYTAIHNKTNDYKGYNWTTKVGKDLYAGYPIHDWLVEDVWVANAKNGWSYNKLYDLYYQAGLSLNQMRVASPFNDAAGDTLKLYKVIEPNTWNKLIGRVNGANFTAIYGGTNALGAKKISLPEGHTWKSYCKFLLDTLPDDIRANYIRKFNTSLEYWTKKGGAIDKDVAEDVKAQINNVQDIGAPTRNVQYKRPMTTLLFDDYPDEVDMKNFAAVPTYKRMCITILKNDYSCKYMGFGQTKDELSKRRRAVEKYKAL